MTTPKICTACGTQYPANDDTQVCKICSEERQYVPEEGQSWITPDELAATHKNEIKKLKDHLFEIVTTPQFAIGQRALLVLSESGNVLWDCISLLDEATIRFINSKGGIKAIAFSHPHYYSNMNDWATTFDCPVYIHKEDEEWIVDKGERIILWEGEEKLLWDGIKVLHIGGHFRGSCVLQISSQSQEGILLCGDTLFLSPSKKHFSIMYSYPNRIPLPLSEIRRIRNRMQDVSFDEVYGFHSTQNLSENVKAILDASLERYFK